jgi:hypothetical protein
VRTSRQSLTHSARWGSAPRRRRSPPRHTPSPPNRTQAQSKDIILLPTAKDHPQRAQRAQTRRLSNPRPQGRTPHENRRVRTLSHTGQREPRRTRANVKRREVRGQAFRVERCVACTIALLDNSEQVVLEKLERCRVIIGACESSVFVRECKNCDMVVATKQLRTRDCTGVRFALFTQTRPVIESSVGLEVGCIRMQWFSQALAMERARLVPLANRWSEVHDFSKGAKHWKRMDLATEKTGLLTGPLPGEGEAPPDLPPGSIALVVGATEADRVACPPLRGEESIVRDSEAIVPPLRGVATTVDESSTTRILLLHSNGDLEAPFRTLLEKNSSFALVQSRVYRCPRPPLLALGRHAPPIKAFARAIKEWPAVIVAVQVTGDGSPTELLRATGASDVVQAAGQTVGTGPSGQAWLSEAGSSASTTVLLDWDAKENKS